MHVAILGAGALGSVYALHLERAGVNVSLATRGRRRGSRWLVPHGPYPAAATPLRASELRQLPSCDLVLLAVRSDQVRGDVQRKLTAHAGPIVSLTPLMPALARDLAPLSERLYAAMPSVIAQLEDDHIGYWVPPLTTTLIARQPLAMALRTRPFANSAFDAPGPAPATTRHDSVVELQSRLVAGGLNTQLTDDVALRNVATTTAFFPLTYGVYRCGGLEPLLANAPTWALVRRATAETLSLGATIGPIEPALRALALATTSGILKQALPMLRALVPGVTQFISQHFGFKLGAQHRELAEEISLLAAQYARPSTQFRQLVGSDAGPAVG